MIGAILGGATFAVYLAAVRAFDRRYPHRRFSTWRVIGFAAGLAVMVLAVAPAVDDLAGTSFAAHMLQHVALTLLGPPLLLLGAPLLLVIAVPPPAIGKAVARLARHPMLVAGASPVLAWVLFVGTLWAIHFSGLYEVALRFETAHVLEHTLLVLTALLFWMPVIQIGYAPRPLAFPARMLYLLLAIPPGTFLGLAIYCARVVMYPHYAAARTFASAIADQQNAGAIMWIGGGAVLFCAFMLTAVVWAARERHEAVA